MRFKTNRELLLSRLTISYCVGKIYSVLLIRTILCHLSLLRWSAPSHSFLELLS